MVVVAAALVVEGTALVGVNEERFVAIFWAARRAVIAVSCKAGNERSASQMEEVSSELGKLYQPIL